MRKMLSSADRVRIEADARKVMEKVVVHVKIYYPLYGALAERLRLKADWRHETMYTDAVVLGYNPAFVLTRSWEYLVYVVVHEITHCALGHPFRRGARVPAIYQEAIDHVTNLTLNKDAELRKMWEAILRSGDKPYADARFAGMAVEQVYNILLAEHQEKQQKQQAKQQAQEQSQSGQDESQSSNGSSSSDEQQSGEDGDEGDLGESSTDKPGDCLDAGASGEKPDDFNDDEGEEDEGSEGDSDTESDQPSDSGMDGDSRDQEGHEEEAAGDSSSGDGAGDASEEEGDSESSGVSEEGGGGGNPSEGDGDPSDQGRSMGLDEAELGELEREWQQAVLTAQLAAGDHLEAAMARALADAQDETRSFVDEIDEFVNTTCSDEESWERRNRRYAEVYLPSNSAPGVKVMVIGIDTSASIGDAELRLMEYATQHAFEDLRIGEMHVVYCDSAVRATRIFTKGDEVTLEDAKGGGGTIFSPVFEYAQELQSEAELAGVIFLTDLEEYEEHKRSYARRGAEEFGDIKTLWVDIEKRAVPPAPPAGVGNVVNLYQ